MLKTLQTYHHKVIVVGFSGPLTRQFTVVTDPDFDHCWNCRKGQLWSSCSSGGYALHRYHCITITQNSWTPPWKKKNLPTAKSDFLVQLFFHNPNLFFLLAKNLPQFHGIIIFHIYPMENLHQKPGEDGKFRNRSPRNTAKKSSVMVPAKRAKAVKTAHLVGGPRSRSLRWFFGGEGAIISFRWFEFLNFQLKSSSIIQKKQNRYKIVKANSHTIHNHGTLWIQRFSIAWWVFHKWVQHYLL